MRFGASGADCTSLGCVGVGVRTVAALVGLWWEVRRAHVNWALPVTGPLSDALRCVCSIHMGVCTFFCFYGVFELSAHMKAVAGTPAPAAEPSRASIPQFPKDTHTHIRNTDARTQHSSPIAPNRCPGLPSQQPTTSSPVSLDRCAQQLHRTLHAVPARYPACPRAHARVDFATSVRGAGVAAEPPIAVRTSTKAADAELAPVSGRSACPLALARS